MKKFIDWIINERKILLFICAIIMIIGAVSYYYIPKEENPDTTFPFAMINTIYPGASAEDVEENVTKALEDAIFDMKDLNKLTSYSMDSSSVLIAEFDTYCDWQSVRNDLNTRISKQQDELPYECETSDVDTDLVDTAEVIIALSSDSYDDQALIAYANDIKTSLERIDGVSRVEIEGEKEQEVSILLDSQKLDFYNISSENIIDLISAQNIDIPSGSIEYQSDEISVSINGEFQSLSEIEDVVVAFGSSGIGIIRLKDIAAVEIRDAQGYLFEQDGKSAVLVCGYFDSGRNSVLVGEQVRDEIELIKQNMPQQILFHEVVYSPNDVSKSINNFMISLLESIMLIIVVVMIGVRFKNGLIISIALPFSILFGFIAMYLLKIEFQFISIAALIISLGILVDNAVVVSDCIQRNIDDGFDKKQAIRDGIKETAIPILTSSITTIVTFGTIYFFSGSVGAVARTIPTVVIAALSASYIAAMIIIPALAYMFFTPMPKEKYDKQSWLQKLFLRFLDIGLKHKALTIVFAFATLGIAVILFMQLGLSFFPYSDKSIVYIDVKAENMNIEYTEKLTEEIHEILEDHPAVSHYTTGIGRAVPRFFMTIPYMYDADNFAQIMVELDLNKDENYTDNESVTINLQDQLDKTIVGADCQVKNLEYAYPSEAKIEIMLLGDDLDTIVEASKDVQSAFHEIEGTYNIRDNHVDNTKKYIINIDEDESIGMLKYDITKQINIALMGYTTSVYKGDDRDSDIVVEVDVNTLDELKQLPITSSITGKQVPLSDIADVTLGNVSSTINHYNKQRYVMVMADVMPGYSSFDIKSEFEEKYSDIIPQYIDVEYKGEIGSMNDFTEDAMLITACAVLLIYIILLLQFKSFKRALIITCTIPLSLIGCFLGLLIFGMDMQAMAILGGIALFGIVVNNGIILIECIDSMVDKGYGTIDACKLAVNVRYRPIIISATTTCVGLIPLILSGDPMSAPMAMVLFFGLMFSTLLTMIVVPTMYAMAVRNR